MPKIVLWGLAGWGLLCLGSTLALVAILCVDWRAWRRKRRTGKCQWCAYTASLGKVTEHEAKDHVREGSGLCASTSFITDGNGAGSTTT
jgi:hypothetical protein